MEELVRRLKARLEPFGFEVRWVEQINRIGDLHGNNPSIIATKRLLDGRTIGISESLNQDVSYRLRSDAYFESMIQALSESIVFKAMTLIDPPVPKKINAPLTAQPAPI